VTSTKSEFLESKRGDGKILSLIRSLTPGDGEGSDVNDGFNLSPRSNIIGETVHGIASDNIRRKMLYEKHKNETKYNIQCCGRMWDRRGLEMLIKIIITFVIIIYSGTMLIVFPSECDDNSAVFLSLITSVVSYWLGKELD